MATASIAQFSANFESSRVLDGLVDLALTRESLPGSQQRQPHGTALKFIATQDRQWCTFNMRVHSNILLPDWFSLPRMRRGHTENKKPTQYKRANFHLRVFSFSDFQNTTPTTKKKIRPTSSFPSSKSCATLSSFHSSSHSSRPLPQQPPSGAAPGPGPLIFETHPPLANCLPSIAQDGISRNRSCKIHHSSHLWALNPECRCRRFGAIVRTTPPEAQMRAAGWRVCRWISPCSAELRNHVASDSRLCFEQIELVYDRWSEAKLDGKLCK